MYTGWTDVDTTTNPLLVQPPTEEITPSLGRSGNSAPEGIYRAVLQSTRHNIPSEGDLRDLQVLNNMFQHVIRQDAHHSVPTIYTGNDILPHDLDAMFDMHNSRTNRPARDDPWNCIGALVPKSTVARWQEEARMLFTTIGNDKALNVLNHILNVLIPVSLKEEQDRKDYETAKRKAEREQAEKERQEKEKLEAERLAAEAEANAESAEPEQLAPAEAEPVADEVLEPVLEANDESKENEMDGVELAEDAASDAGSGEGADASTERVIVTVGGREVDITGSGIDPEFLEALPEDMREEVLTAHLREAQSSAIGGPAPESEIEAEFLAALPANIREELLQQEANERRRASREREQREAVSTTSGAEAESALPDIDYASFLASLDPALRQTILAEQDEEVLAHLPQNIAEEAHEIQRRHNIHAMRDYLEIDIPTSRLHPLRNLPRSENPVEETHKPTRNRNGIQLVDRSGVASLVRLLYLPQNNTQRNPLLEMLVSVTANKQSRSELFNMILSILHDGSMDIASVERCFSQITARARPQQLTNLNTPTKAGSASKSPATPAKSGNMMSATHGSIEISPLQLAQHCLGALEYVIKTNRQLATYFLIEHESPIGLKRSMSRKGKTKDMPLAEGAKYPINTLLSLLDRSMIRDSSVLMDMISTLLQEVTRPLQVLIRKNSEKPNDADAKEGGKALEEPSVNVSNGESVGDNAELSETRAVTGESAEVQPAQHRKLSPPVIPEHNLCLLVNILTARECPNRTLQQTLAAMQNLSAIPGAMDTFGRELIRQAQELGQALPLGLKELSELIRSANTGSEVQGMALSRFSPASSDQAKLLRVLTAVDYLFDSSRDSDSEDRTGSGDALIELYASLEFGSLWDALGNCLHEIQERSDMLHVATVLLPLIEAFMVVCKREIIKETEEMPQTQVIPNVTSNVARVDSLQVPENERKPHLFYRFTDEHRKILNQMVRNNPKLMSGSFSILVKNPKVLDFDNKRNFFYRQLHLRAQNSLIHRPLIINVRRDQVFLDSYKALYFKNGDEIKFSKLNIRFHGEEGVDAGGVTREWFQVLARQMFNADYALFTPVASDRTTFHPNRTSGVNPEHLLFFKFIGRIIGKALYEGRVLDCHFSRAVYKRILGRHVSLKDMENLDLEYYKSLVWMLENDITDVITETMSLEADDYGDKKIIDLIPNGRDIAVTEENKAEYVRLVVGYRLLTSVEEQLDSFLKGMFSTVDLPK